MNDLPELKSIRNLTYLVDNDLVRARELSRVNLKNRSFPIISFEIGSKDPEAPVLGLFGGVHGLERVGSHVVISYLKSLLKQIKWDSDLREQLKTSRIVSIPLINPGGMAMARRSNPNGVDLMRNAPVDADHSGRLPFLIGGHRYSNKLPWYRGDSDGGLELEAQVLVDYVREQIYQAETALTVDFHSGFGMKDRFWYPYAGTTAQFPSIAEVECLKDLLDDTLPHHIYNVEPQSLNYTANGDLWDFMYDEHRRLNEGRTNLFIPWTLEMGSWNWIRKNPSQIFKAKGLFNPIIEHRHERTMRRHKGLIDFLFRATRNTTWRDETLVSSDISGEGKE